jgi:hypothetical protein
MKRIIMVIGLAVVTTFGSVVLAQDQNISIMMFGNLLQPTGRFSDNIGEGASLTRRFGFNIGDDAGLATRGFGGGLELSTPVLTNNLAWVIGARVLFNPVDDTNITDFFEDEYDDTLNVKFENGSWFNVPIFTGLRYHYGISNDLNVYAIAQGGVNLTRQASRKAYVEGVLAEETTFRLSPDFGYELGFGVEFLKTYNIGVRYLNLGAPRYEGTRRLNERFFPLIPKREMYISGDTRPVSMVVLFLGYTL